MIPYYGAKTKVIHLYPPPQNRKIIEPFAGSARYSLRYFEHEITLVDKYAVIIQIWKWLQQCSPGDVLRLPRLKEGQNVNDFEYDCPEARLLMGFLCGFSASSPRNMVTIKLSQRPNYINYNLRRIARDLFKIKHWNIIHGSYEDIPDQEATWFVDPPYAGNGGEEYIESSKNIDYSNLKDFCLSRSGQVIVCEGSNADWLDFKPVARQRTRNGTQHEMMWTNQEASLNHYQFKLFH